MNADTLLTIAFAYGLLIFGLGIGWTMTRESEAEQERRRRIRKDRLNRHYQQAATEIHDALETQDRTNRAVLESSRGEQERLWEKNRAQALNIRRERILRSWGGDYEGEDMTNTERRTQRILPRIFYIDLLDLLERALRGFGIRGMN